MASVPLTLDHNIMLSKLYPVGILYSGKDIYPMNDCNAVAVRIEIPGLPHDLGNVAEKDDESALQRPASGDDREDSVKIEATHQRRRN